MLVKYCDTSCQHKHWPRHKAACKLRAAELRDEALFKDTPPREDCPICFLPMPKKLINCITLPPATVSSVPIYDFAMANQGLKDEDMEVYYPCCGKIICGGCIHSCRESGNTERCPFCNSEGGKTDEERVEEIIKRVAANDAVSICVLADSYHRGLRGLPQDQAKAMELYARAAELVCSKAHYNLGNIYHEGGDKKKAKFHDETAAIAGHEGARYNLGVMDDNPGNIERAGKHWTIAASAGHYEAMQHLLTLCFEKGHVSRESIDSTLAAYNASCAEMRSEARDAYIRMYTSNIGAE